MLREVWRREEPWVLVRAYSSLGVENISLHRKQHVTLVILKWSLLFFALSIASLQSCIELPAQRNQTCPIMSEETMSNDGE